jgi:hypothetical protein
MVFTHRLYPHTPVDLIALLQELRIRTSLFTVRVEIVTFVEDWGEEFWHGHFSVLELTKRVFLPLWLL